MRFNDGTVLLISVSTYRASKSFLYFFISEKYYMGMAFLFVPERFTFKKEYKIIPYTTKPEIKNETIGHGKRQLES